jgi:transcriptional regulator with XRE-family HTH domain|tara:strand:+ start:55 stop:438 length:384 start_codon:yes stop_codon:yes gene_type:complete
MNKINKRYKSEYSKWKPSDLREIRKKLNLTQAKMGEKIGVSPRMFRFYESGHTKISLSMEYAMKYLLEKEIGTEEFEKLTPFERERMERLRDGITKELDKGENNVQFSYIFRMCRQAVKEFDNILSK